MPVSDPLVEQTSVNKANQTPPIQSGSHPQVAAEEGSPTRKENPVESLLEHAFGKDVHDQEISGAGVGNHPKF